MAPQQASASATTAWKDSSTPTPQQQPKTPSWAAPENPGQGNTQIPSPTSGGGGGGIGWGDQATPQGQVTSPSTKSSTPYDRDGITTAGWGAANTKPVSFFNTCIQKHLALTENIIRPYMLT